MKYVKEFDTFNEGFMSNFNKLVLAVMIGYGSFNIYRDVSFLKSVYNEVNDPRNIPNKTEAIQIENIRNSVIDIIKNSDRFNKFGKDFIVDSLKTIEFRLGDIPDRNSIGSFINITNMKKYWASKLFVEPDKDNFIFISKSQLYDKNVNQLIFHELYHYYDHLLEDYSKTLDLTEVYDKRFLTDKTYAYSKIAVFLTGGRFSYSDNEQMDGYVRTFYENIFARKNYFTSSKEIFARWNSMKYKMVQFGIIDTFNDEINPERILDLLTHDDIELKDNCEYLEFIVFMSFDDKDIKRLNDIL